MLKTQLVFPEKCISKNALYKDISGKYRPRDQNSVSMKVQRRVRTSQPKFLNKWTRTISRATKSERKVESGGEYKLKVLFQKCFFGEKYILYSPPGKIRGFVFLTFKSRGTISGSALHLGMRWTGVWPTHDGSKTWEMSISSNRREEPWITWDPFAFRSRGARRQ